MKIHGSKLEHDEHDKQMNNYDFKPSEAVIWFLVGCAITIAVFYFISK